MSRPLFINNNGDIIPADSYAIRAGNRAFNYGDGLFESIRVINGKPIGLEHHYSRLKDGMKALKMNHAAYMNQTWLADEVNKLIEKNKIDQGGKVRLTVFRNQGGRFLPSDNDVSFLLEAEPLEQNFYVLNDEGLHVDIYPEMKKQLNQLSIYKTNNCLLYVMASLYAKEKGLDNVFITNDKGGIIEATNANIFIVSNGVLYTPSLEEGCLAGTMRMQIINKAIDEGIKVYECNLMPQNLLVADEIFLTNALTGVNWVVSYRTKRYYNTMAKKIVNLLNAPHGG